ncbi:hypothetical protein JIN85_08290 [Luteolibacter pohnpeiensis]|uniref:Uncharacterized protein n=1 Tax=Luteolibacter pohnpeiensis TaxID=454153 RepID=A0A934VVP3_9BACT|nr:hypothetical protein [Luteolibacter pohnpeiensis]MBK1882410.1 hypothetical protein [Luteolibacter pohnpeiensis]
MTMLLMALLTLIGVGLLSLSAVSLRTVDRSSPGMEARANARLALMMAINELQRYMGPDQRVTAENRILSPLSQGDSKQGQPHWVNVWRTTKDDGSPFIIRNAEDGGLHDLRVDEKWDPAEHRLTTLVSGNESAYQYYDYGRGEGMAVDMVRLVGGGSVPSENGNSPDFVSAPEVGLYDGHKKRGSYAWWVGDLNEKANIATQDRLEDSSLDAAGVRSIQIAQDASLLAFDNQSDLQNSDRAKLTGMKQLDLVNPSTTPISSLAFHDLTTDSEGLLVNVRDGGLKKDLTAYLESDGTIPSLNSNSGEMPGVSDYDRLIGPRNQVAEQESNFPGQAARYSKVSPTFGLLRDWARRGEKAPFGSFQTVMQSPEISSVKSNVGRSYGGVKHLERTKTDLMPVLVESSMFYNISYYEDSGGNSKAPYHLRIHYYPRVALWNPYNFDMQIDSSMVFMMINGKKRVRITGESGQTYGFRMYFGIQNASDTGGTGGAVQGSMFFALEGKTLKAGETAVWSPRRNQVYDETTFSNNLLTPSVAPSPSRAFYMNEKKLMPSTSLFTVIQTTPPTKGLYNDRMIERPVEWREYVGALPAGNVQSAGYTQADDYKVVWKPLRSSGAIDADRFEDLPPGLFVSCAFQYGDEDEMPVEWSSTNPVPMAVSSLENPVIQDIPDTRTRDGFRLRWFDEPESNRIGAGSLSGTPFLQEAPMANWNMRASYSFRSPFENVNDTAPNFFGIYTRDLFDPEVGWNGMNPSYKEGGFRSDPFDQPSRFSQPRILFDIPRRGAEVISLGAFQQVKMSEYIWQPTYAFGNSLADPRLDPTRTEPNRKESVNKDEGGWNSNTIGFATDGRSNNNGSNVASNEDLWAYYARNYLNQAAVEQNLIFDMSYELNYSLWDEFFLSSGNRKDKLNFINSPYENPLPDGRMSLAGTTDDDTIHDLSDFYRAASVLKVDGAFNVNSTSVKAWEALLLSSAGQQFDDDQVTFPRILQSQGGGSGGQKSHSWGGGNSRDENAWDGQRTLSRDEVRRLAEEIVEQVKIRGPFLSMADFVNRSLSTGEEGKKGALQAAIDRSGINASFEEEWKLDNQDAIPDYTHPDHIDDPTRIDQTLKPDTGAWGALGFLTQADLLQFLGPVLTVRSDSFVVRAYGSSVDKHGKVQAQAWCEAVVQRTATPLRPDSQQLNPLIEDGVVDLGRKFEIRKFRWLKPEDV